MVQPGGVSLSGGYVVGKANWRDRHATMMFLHWKGRCGTVRYGTGRYGTVRCRTVCMVRHGMVRDGAGRDDVHSDWVDFKSKRADRTTGTTRILRYVGYIP